MKCISKIGLLLFILSFSMGLANAQLGGRGDRDDDRPIRESAQQAAQNAAQEIINNGELPENLSDLNIPDNMPQSREELEDLIEGLELPDDFDFATILEENIGAASEEAYAATISFAATHLGATVTPVYSQKLRTDLVQDATLPDELIAELPEEIQVFLLSVANADIESDAYYALLEDGISLVYTTTDCLDDNCAMDLGTLQYNIDTASLGTYVRYLNMTLYAPEQAQNLILSTYPALSDYTLEPVAMDESLGYAFTASHRNDGNAVAYYVGVTARERQTAIYVISAVGDGYINLGFPN